MVLQESLPPEGSPNPQGQDTGIPSSPGPCHLHPFLLLLAPAKSSPSQARREMKLAGPKMMCILLRKRGQSCSQSLDYRLSTLIPFYSTLISFYSTLIPFYSRVVLETSTGASKTALGKELPPTPGNQEIQCSRFLLFCLEVYMYPGLQGGSHHPPFQSHTDSLWMTTLLLSTNNSNMLQETRRQLWPDSALSSMGLRVCEAKDTGCP